MHSSDGVVQWMEEFDSDQTELFQHFTLAIDIATPSLGMNLVVVTKDDEAAAAFKLRFNDVIDHRTHLDMWGGWIPHKS